MVGGKSWFFCSTLSTSEFLSSSISKELFSFLSAVEIAEPQVDEVVREVEAAQMPHESNPLYHWVTRDVMGSPCTLTEEYLAKLKCFGVICGGGEEERLYRVELRRRGERFGVRIPFTPFQQRLLQRCFVAPSQFHPDPWSVIRCFELVTEFLELPQDPEVFLYFFTVFSPNAEGKSKKGYMSVGPGKYRRIFGLYEESFHDFKGRYFKVFPVGDHPPFWLTLERDAGRFPSYWSKDAGLNYVPQNLRPKAILGNPERARATIAKMAEKNKTLANLRRAMVANPQGLIVLSSSAGQASSSIPEGGSFSNVDGGAGNRPEVSSPTPEEVLELQVEIPPPSSSLGKRGAEEAASAQKRPRIFEGSQRDFCPIDRSFDASGYIEANFLGPSRGGLTRLRPNGKSSLGGVGYALFSDDDEKADVEKEKEEVEAAKSKVDKDLESALADSKEKGVELQRLRDPEANLSADLRSAEEKFTTEKSRADLAEASLAATEQARRELVKLAEDSVKATEDALKE
ncbi:hypothetical protein PIB30_053374 [Stylosanthes scabra]|uniref:Uncharacterized protein n=1 Tax=Stylosanthes scabra TaxID=79078 RepID=A0ABU6RID7_9FABA|nr:hypothetical protein [Stylosanthes scabra]